MMSLPVVAGGGRVVAFGFGFGFQPKGYGAGAGFRMWLSHLQELPLPTLRVLRGSTSWVGTLSSDGTLRLEICEHLGPPAAHRFLSGGVSGRTEAQPWACERGVTTPTFRRKAPWFVLRNLLIKSNPNQKKNFSNQKERSP